MYHYLKKRINKGARNTHHKDLSKSRVILKGSGNAYEMRDGNAERKGMQNSRRSNFSCWFIENLGKSGDIGLRVNTAALLHVRRSRHFRNAMRGPVRVVKMTAVRKYLVRFRRAYAVAVNEYLITSISPFVVAATVASIIHALNARKRF
jgi:hypothetical protein